MTTATRYSQHAEVDFDLLEANFDQAVGAEPAAQFTTRQLHASFEPDDLLEEAGGRSVPDSVAQAAVFGRCLRTIGPIVVADLVALAIAAMLGRLVLGWVMPDAGRAIGWAAPLTLLLLVIGYWFSGLYTELWVHAAVELRQLTHVTSLGMLSAAAGAMFTEPVAVWCLAAWPVALAGVPLLRTIARFICAPSPDWGFPTLVIGSGAEANAVVRSLMRDTHSGLRRSC